MLNLLNWFSLWWYRYLCSSKSWENLFCRIKGHPNGVVWYNYSYEACEPDMRCKDCGEDLG